MTEKQAVQQAALQWKENGHPASRHFDDIYFSCENGLKESFHTFILHNNLPERFSQLRNNQSFTVCETGFGTGLNFLNAWMVFEKHAVSKARLHFISIEKYPLDTDDLKKALMLWPELERFSKSLLEIYPSSPTPGFHSFPLENGRITLTLIFKDIGKALPEINGKVDAWFLDGFAPNKNPEMWSSMLYREMARLSSQNTTYATFTAARNVRDGLAQAGFSILKVKGYGRKRHMIHGQYQIPASKTDSWLKSEKIWVSRQFSRFSERKAIIIGAGLAGCSTAMALAEKGWQVRLVDSGPDMAEGTSGNLQGALYMRLSGTNTVLSELLVQGYFHTLNILHSRLAADKGRLWNSQGLIQTGFTMQEKARQQKIMARALPTSLVSARSGNQLSALAGMEIAEEGLWFEQGGWVHPAALCKALASNEEQILFAGEHTVQEIRYQNGHWLVLCKEGHQLTAPVVILANNHSVSRFTQTAHLPLKTIRGQVTYVPSSPTSQALKAVVCAECYVTPCMDGVHTIGATHSFNDMDTSVRHEDHLYNLASLKKCFPYIYSAIGGDALRSSELAGRAGIRCTTPDYLPVIGPVIEEEKFHQQFFRLSKDANAEFDHPPALHPGLFVNAGHGSRGLITAPLGGRIIAGYLENEVMPVSTRVLEALHPGRFPARSLIRTNSANSSREQGNIKT